MNLHTIASLIAACEPAVPSGPECPNCGSQDVEEDEEIFEDTAGRCYRSHVLVCLECGKVFR